jgi:hypothetical protein
MCILLLLKKEYSSVADVRKTTDTGAEITPVELWSLNDSTGLTAKVPLGLFAAQDGLGGAFSGFLSTDYNLVFTGSVWDRMRAPSQFVPVNAVGITANTAIWTPAAGKKVRVMGYQFTTTVAGAVILKDNSATVVAVFYGAAGIPGPAVELSNGFILAAANNPLTAIGPGGAVLHGLVWGSEE